VHDRMGSVYAFRAELDDWARSRTLRAASDKTPPSEPSEADAETDFAPPAQNTPGSAVAPIPNRLNLLVLLAPIGLALAIAIVYWFQSTEYFWRSPIAGGQAQTLAEFEGEGLSAAVSHDGHFVALLSDRDG